MQEYVSNKVLDDIKNYLKVPYTNDANDKNILGMINRGVAYLNNIAGMQLDYEDEDLPRQLLFDYVRYAYSQALEVFSKNFQPDLLALHYKEQSRNIQLEGDEDED